MNESGHPNEERSAKEELSETGLTAPRTEQELQDSAERASVETTVTDGAHVLDELGEDVASSPAQRAKPKPGPPVKSR